MHSPRYDERRAGRPLVLVTEPGQLWPPLPPHWAKTTIDDLHTLGGAGTGPFSPREGLSGHEERRPTILATVTRWAQDGAPYQQIHVLYVLTREAGRLGIKSMVELAVADRPVAAP